MKNFRKLCCRITLLLAFVLLLGSVGERPSTLQATETGARTSASAITSEVNAEADVMEEVLSKRGEYEKHFYVGNDSYMAVSYDEPVHYLEDGEWKEIDNTLVLEQKLDGTSYYKTKRGGKMNVSFAAAATQEKMVNLEYKGHTLSWSLQAAPQVYDTVSKRDNATLLSLRSQALAKPAVSAAVKEASEETDKFAGTYAKKVQSEVLYQNVLDQDQVDIRYTVTSTKVKEDIVLNKATDQHVFYVNLSCPGLTASLQEDQSVAFWDGEGNLAFIMTTPYMYDSAEAYSEAIVVRLLQNGEGDYTVILEPDVNWLKDAKRSYPVTIDPVYATSAASTTYIIDTHVREGSPNSTAQNSAILYVGNYGGGQSWIYLRHANLPTISEGFITGATEMLRINRSASTFTTTPGLSTFICNNTWSSATLTWNNKPAENTTNYQTMESNVLPVDEAVHSEYYLLDLGIAVREWYMGCTDGSRLGGGIMIRYTDTSRSDYIGFYSGDCSVVGYRPRLLITYVKPSYTVTPGTYYIRNARTGNYLDVENAGTAVGTNVINWYKNNTDAQKWIIEKDSARGYYTLSPVVAPSLRLGLEGSDSSDKNGLNVKIYSANDNANQRFAFIPTDGEKFAIVSKHSRAGAIDAYGDPVTVGSTQGGRNTHYWRYNPLREQHHWILEPVSGTSNVSGIQSGKVYKLRNTTSNKYLTVYGGYEYSGTNIVLQQSGYSGVTYSDTTGQDRSQLFRVVRDSQTGKYKFYAICAQNGRVNLMDWTRSTGDISLYYPANPVTNSFTVEAASGGYRIKIRENSTDPWQYLTASGTAAGANVCVSKTPSYGDVWAFELATEYNADEAYYGQMGWLDPYAGALPAIKMNSHFGYRNVSVGSTNHRGLDMLEVTDNEGNAIGMPVVFPFDGRIIKMEYNSSSGNTIVIESSEHYVRGTSTKLVIQYMHLVELPNAEGSNPSLQVGQIYRAGTVAGRIGNTGSSSGAHLHMAVLKGADAQGSGQLSSYLDPMLFYPKTFFLLSGTSEDYLSIYIDP